MGLDLMKGNMIGKLSLEIFQMIKYHLFHHVGPVYMQVTGPAQQAEGRDQSKNPEYMVTMKMADKDMVDFAQLNPEFPQLHLGSFSAVDQKKPLTCIKQMSG